MRPSSRLNSQLPPGRGRSRSHRMRSDDVAEGMPARIYTGRVSLVSQDRPARFSTRGAARLRLVGCLRCSAVKISREVPMFRPRSLLRATGAGIALAALACRESPAPTGPETGLLPDRAKGAELPTANDLERGVPGFGGFFLGRDGTPSVYLKAGADRGPAEQAFGAYMRGQGRAPEAVRVLPGRYLWRQLEGWRDQVRAEVLDIPGPVYVDNDETSNRVRVGVQDLSAHGLVRAAVARLGIPSDAVVVSPSDPIVQMSTLRDAVDRPVRAGVKINSPGSLCSGGFTATSSGQKSFTPASHCTNKQGGDEGLLPARRGVE